MRQTLSLVIIFMLAVITAVQAQAPGDNPVLVRPPTWFVYGVIIVILAAAFIALLLVRMAIEESRFSLGDALSEEGKANVMEKDVAGHDTPRIGSDGKPMTMTVMVASISRVIALLGTIALMVLFIGFGTFVMYYFGTGQGVPKDLDKVVTFLVAGLTLFAPYVVNQFSKLFDPLGRRR